MNEGIHVFIDVHETRKKFPMNYDAEVAKLDDLLASLDECIQVDDTRLAKLQSFLSEAERISTSSRYVNLV